MYEAKILADSVSLAGHRLTTFQITFPRIVLAEFNTHRCFSRNSASSRAIPVEKMLAMVEDDAYIPVFTGAKKGMSGTDMLENQTWQADCITHWNQARYDAAYNARRLLSLGVHKQDVNRLLEPFLWHTAVVTSTDYGNFFKQRCDLAAHPAIRTIACMMADLYYCRRPRKLLYGDWHIPYRHQADREDIRLRNENFAIEGIAISEYDTLCKVSAARCARVSYLTQEGKRDIKQDLNLFDRLIENGHWSPLEHVARPCYSGDASNSNFTGWHQLRKDYPNEFASYSPPNTEE